MVSNKRSHWNYNNPFFFKLIDLSFFANTYTEYVVLLQLIEKKVILINVAVLVNYLSKKIDKPLKITNTHVSPTFKKLRLFDKL